MGVETWILLVTVVVLAYLYSRWRHSHWSSRGVPSPDATPFVGHLHKFLLGSQTPWVLLNKLRDDFSDSRMCGLYELFKPTLLIWDPEVLRHILVKDFDHFTDRRKFDMSSGEERDLTMMEMLSVKNGPEWKSLRAVMTPTFSSGKIKSMFPLMCDKADELIKFSMKQAAENKHVEMKKNFGRFTIDTIASCAFGIECNSLVDEEAEFPRRANAFFEISTVRLLKFVAVSIVPRLVKAFRISINSPDMDFFIDVVNQTVAAREAGETRGDFLDLLLEARDKSSNLDGKEILSQRSLVAQSVLFIIAGYETTASLLAFSSFLLAKHKEQQQRLRAEVMQLVAEHGDITYQGIMEAKLLDACLQESLRLYPPTVATERVCVKTWNLPGKNLTLKPGELVQIPILTIHHDPRNWSNPEDFIPDRFLPKNKDEILPFTHLPFGMGPRNCIAMRFALLEAKVALAKLLLKAEMELPPGQENLEIIASGGLLRPKNDVKMILKPIVEK